jgi:hypothetical protein
MKRNESSQKKRKSSSNKSFASFTIRRRVFNVWFVEREFEIINRETRRRSRISHEETLRIMFSEWQRISNSKFDFFQIFSSQTWSKSISSTCRVLIISTSSRNHHFLLRKMKFDKRLNDANRTMRQDLTTFSIAFSKYSLTNWCRIYWICFEHAQRW